MTCHDVELCLSAWVDCELDPDDAAAVADHLRSCAACRRRSDVLASARDIFRTLAPPAAAVASGGIRPQRYYAPMVALVLCVLLLLPIARSADVPAMTLVPEPQFVPGLDCNVTDPGPSCEIDLPPAPCGSVLDCSPLAP